MSNSSSSRAAQGVRRAATATTLPDAPRAVPRRRAASGEQLGEDTARAMILQGAARVFGQRGVRLATVEDILTAARVSRRTFYRLYEGKEDVMLALYMIGTQGLVDACRAIVEQEREPLRQILRFIDAHLSNASQLGRLVFVLGGEAQRRESSLHARRIEVHEVLTDLLVGGASAHYGKPLDPLLFRSVLLALEGVSRLVLEEGDEGRAVADSSIERARRVMTRVATAALAGQGAGVAPLPTLK
ncbi:MAG TPA: TetR/AcrR family transcriptional regulator [Polyangiaceae bacterium]